MDVKVTRYDVIQARNEYDNHRARHGCRIGDHCNVRAGLWLAWMKLAEKWNEPA